MRVNNNIAALNAWRNLSVNNGNLNKALEKLSSGSRINKAADDAAGLAVSEKMRAQIRGLNAATRNAQDGISLIQTAEGGAAKIGDMLQRMRELSVQASNDSLQNSDRSQLHEEFQELAKEINRTAGATKFNDKQLLSGSATSRSMQGESAANGATMVSIGIDNTSSLAAGTYVIEAQAVAGDNVFTIRDMSGNSQGSITGTGLLTGTINGVTFDFTGTTVTTTPTNVASFNVQTQQTGGALNIAVGPNRNDSIAFTLDSLTGVALGITSTTSSSTLALNAGVAINTQTDANNTIATIDTALGTVNTARAKMGAYQNRLENAIDTLQVQSENLTAAESRIRDVDMAAEMSNFTKFQVLSQAGTSMLAQANQATQGVLSLLR